MKDVQQRSFSKWAFFECCEYSKRERERVLYNKKESFEFRLIKRSIEVCDSPETMSQISNKHNVLFPKCVMKTFIDTRRWKFQQLPIDFQQNPFHIKEDQNQFLCKTH